jgi:hypothetical protein
MDEKIVALKEKLDPLMREAAETAADLQSAERGKKPPRSPLTKELLLMRADYINPFIKSLDHVFKTMLHCDVKRGQPYIRVDNQPGKHVSGVIGLSGKAAGAVVLSLSEEFAIRAAAIMLDCAVSQIDADV